MLAVTSDIIWVVYTLAWITMAFLASAHVVMHKRDPRSMAIWVLAAFVFPIVGPWFYWIFGVNRIERRAKRRLRRRPRPFDAGHPEHASDDICDRCNSIRPLARLRVVADRVAQLPLLDGNKITALHNGEQAYPAMLEAIRNAKKSVTLLSYIFDWDDIGRGFADTLGEAADRGVTVCVLVDGVGALGHFSRMGSRLLKTEAKVASFFPLLFPLGRIRVNLRNHRKILVVDGRIGFTGGMNISQRHLLDSSDENRCEDMHFRVEGPVVSELQHAFAEDWDLATKEVLTGAKFFPKIEPVGPAVCRGIASGPDQNVEVVHWVMHAAFTAANERITLVTPYFAPSSRLLSAMIMAAMRGVEVTLVLPDRVDVRYMRWIADAYLRELLEHGVRVYRRPGPFVHTKLMIVDGQWVLLGSANFDPRSFRLNFEFNVEAYDQALAEELEAVMAQKIKAAHKVTLKEIEARPTWRRLRDGLAKVFSPNL